VMEDGAEELHLRRKSRGTAKQAGCAWTRVAVSWAVLRPHVDRRLCHLSANGDSLGNSGLVVLRAGAWGNLLIWR
jgi:hypothetical protein